MNDKNRRMNKSQTKLSGNFILLICLLITANLPKTYGAGNFSLSAGWGNYNLVNVGIQWNYSEKSSLSAFYGTNFQWGDSKSQASGLSYKMVFRQSLIGWKIKPGFSIGTIYWTQDDELYYFKTLSFPAMAILAYPLSPKLSLHIEGGGIYNSVLVSDRKQNVEAGHPLRVNGIYRIGLIYKLGKK